MGETPNLTFGEELRRERLIREVSLEEISGATKISVRLLTALEKSDLAKLPAPVFTRGFIRSYSRHLGLDPEEMVNAYLADLAPEKSREATPKKGGLRARFLRGRRAAAGTLVVSVAATLLLLGLIARPRLQSEPGRTSAGRSVAPVRFKNVSVSPAPMPAPIVPEPPATSDPSTPVRGVSMLLEFDQDSWTEISADGAPIFTGLVRRGNKRQFVAREGFRLTLGNAGGVRVTVDGHALEPLGTSGQVVRDLRVPPPRLTQS